MTVRGQLSNLAGGLTRERGALAGDACLLTAAGFGLVMGTITLTLAPDGEPAEGMTWMQGMEWISLLSAILGLGALILGPLVAWRLHDRPLTWLAVLGAAVGGFVSGFVVMSLALLSLAVGLLVSWVSGSELAGPITVLILVGAGFVALIVWLVTDGVRDLSPSRRMHPRLDVVRLICAAVLVVFGIGVALWTASHPGDESAEAIIFAMATGVSAAMIVSGAEVATSVTTPGKTVSGFPGS